MKPAPFPNRRRVRLVDDMLQKYLLVALVVMETLAVAIAIWALYQALGEIVDENTYRIHFSGAPSILSQLLGEGLRVLGAMLLLNVLALIAADRIWAWYVRRVVSKLDQLMAASSRLDFSGQEAIPFHHAVLDQAVAWRQTELRRLAGLRAGLRGLPAQLPASGEQRDAAAALLKTIHDA